MLWTGRLEPPSNHCPPRRAACNASAVLYVWAKHISTTMARKICVGCGSGCRFLWSSDDWGWRFRRERFTTNRGHIVSASAQLLLISIYGVANASDLELPRRPSPENYASDFHMIYFSLTFGLRRLICGLRNSIRLVVRRFFFRAT